MAERLTPQQEAAVKNRGGKLLVSAAAGSGKTKVLVDRLMSYLLDPVDPADLDEFLIITYTKAAAAELRGKIAAKLSERMAEFPENRHLQRQMQRLYLTKISTVHSFCGDILREYAYLVDLPADFRVADENECRQLRDGAMKKLLDAAYRNSTDADFRAFVDSQGLGRNDALVAEILLKVYDGSRCHLKPGQWLQQCIENADTDGLTDASETVWGNYLIDDLREYLNLQIKSLLYCAEAADRAGDMPKPAALLRDTVAQLQRLAEYTTWDEIFLNRQIQFGTLTFSKKIADPELAETVKEVRNACKEGVQKRLKAFNDPSAVVLEDLAFSASAVRGMVSLVNGFDAEYQRAKKARRILDFADLEHRMLDLLTGKSRSGATAAAAEIGRRFREIMVDEYQDSHAVQDAIFGALTEKRRNCFMVGDVKQSIYQFRLADPSIFLTKYNSYADADEAQGNEGRKVMLSANFRSGGAVLAGVNDVFEVCMSPAVGGLHYGEEEALHEGVPHTPLGEPEVELWTIPVQESAYEEEVAFVAKRIQELTDGSHFIRKGDELRTIGVDDIAILLRSPGSMGSYFKNALAACGIRCISGGGNDLLQTREVSDLHAILQVISNPRQDIPLIAALTSPAFSISADDLAVIRSGSRNGTVYDALLKSDMPKVHLFLEHLACWRREARLRSLAQLLESVFRLTHMDSVYAAMENGDMRKRNLQLFYEIAVGFEATGRRDLEQFLEHLEAMKDKGLIDSGEQSSAGAVTLMSIHKSKGLEFPVVFVCGLSRSFNRDALRAQVLFDKSLGLGLTAVDEKNRVRYPTVAKRAISSKIVSDSVSEELRVLYVALTRARDRLIMTYASKSLQKDVSELAMRMDADATELLTRDVSCMGDWVLLAALRRTEAGELFALGAKPAHTTPGRYPWLIRVCEVTPSTAYAPESEKQAKVLPSEITDELQKRLSFRYAHSAATSAPSKQTATQRKGRIKDTEVSENAQKPPMDPQNWRSPSFISAKTNPADFGNAMHAVMQYLRYECCVGEMSIREEVDRLVQENYITYQQGQIVDCARIAAFFSTQIGKKLRTHPDVVREFKFSVLDDGENFSDELRGEKILLQGVVDCAMIDDEGITVIDFKTDYVTDATLADKLEQYRPQVKAYADAMQRIYQKPIKEALLYFFRVDQFVTVE